MNSKIQALEDNGTWTYTTLPQNKKPIQCHWVYKIKYQADGSIEKYKARLIAKGYSQVQGEDLTETFAPMTKLTTVKCILALTSQREWPLFQLDVNNVFLHGDLEEDIYMVPPPGIQTQEPGQFYKLQKSLYGLRQAGYNWFIKWSTTLKSFGFVQHLAE